MRKRQVGFWPTELVRSYGLKQELITPYTPQQNGLVERMIRMLKEQCIHSNRFETRNTPVA